MKLRSASKYPGGKGALTHHLIPLAPTGCTTYIETHAGMLSVLLNLKKHDREIANDSNPDVINFWKILQGDLPNFLDIISKIKYNRDNFDFARSASTLDQFGDPPYYSGNYRRDHAIAFFVRHRMSRSGDGKSYSWSDRPRGGQPESINAWETIQSQLPAISERIKDVEFRCGDAVKLLWEHQGNPFAFFYVDPPYFGDERKTKNLYIHEMSRDEHRILLETLNWMTGNVMLSGYNSSLYANMLEPSQWNKTEIKVKCTAGQTKTKSDRTEVVWRNYPRN